MKCKIFDVLNENKLNLDFKLFVFSVRGYKRGLEEGEGGHSVKMSGGKATSLEAVSLWLGEKLRIGNVPRITDIMDMVKREGLSIKRKDIVSLLQKDPVYLFNLHQQKKNWVEGK